jgi:hypothetical protein
MAMLVGTNQVGSAQERLYLVHLPEGPGGPVRPVCYFDSPAAPAKLFGWPTWSPDGSGLAWLESDGIHVADVPDLGAVDLNCATITNRVLVFGSEPFWGAADVPDNAGTRAPGAAEPRTRAHPRADSRAHRVSTRERRYLAAATNRPHNATTLRP